MIELAGGRVIAVEIKASASVRPDDARHLAWLRDELGEQFGTAWCSTPALGSSSLGDRITATPICVLWS